MTYISESDKLATANTLSDFGYVETDPCTYHLALTDGLGWLVEYDYRRYAFSEWNSHTRTWRKLADFFSGEALTTMLEAIGARTECA